MTDELGTCHFCRDILTGDDRFCPTCGREASHALAAGADSGAGLPDISAPEPSPDLSPAPADRAAGAVLVMAGAVLIAGALLPWVTNTLGDTFNGLAYEWAGLPVIVAGACLAVLGAWGAMRPGGRSLFMTGTAVSVIAAAFGVLCLAGTRSFMAQRAGMHLPVPYGEFLRVGAGIYVVLAGAVLGAAGSLRGAVRKRGPRRAQPLPPPGRRG